MLRKIVKIHVIKSHSLYIAWLIEKFMTGVNLEDKLQVRNIDIDHMDCDQCNIFMATEILREMLIANHVVTVNGITSKAIPKDFECISLYAEQFMTHYENLDVLTKYLRCAEDKVTTGEREYILWTMVKEDIQKCIDVLMAIKSDCRQIGEKLEDQLDGSNFKMADSIQITNYHEFEAAQSVGAWPITAVSTKWFR